MANCVVCGKRIRGTRANTCGGRCRTALCRSRKRRNVTGVAVTLAADPVRRLNREIHGLGWALEDVPEGVSAEAWRLLVEGRAPVLLNGNEAGILAAMFTEGAKLLSLEAVIPPALPSREIDKTADREPFGTGVKRGRVVAPSL